MNSSDTRSSRSRQKWAASGALGNMTSAKLNALRRHLVETVNSGANTASVEAMYELAPGVWLVLDRYQGQTEYDFYFDLDRADLTAAAKSESRARYPGLNKMRIDCLGYGPGHLDLALRSIKEHYLELKEGSVWNESPRQISL